MAAVGPDSLPTATAMPSMSAFVTESRGSEHIGSVASSYISEGIFRKGAPLCRKWAVRRGAVSLYATCNEVAGLHKAMSEVVAVNHHAAFEWKAPVFSHQFPLQNMGAMAILLPRSGQLTL